MPSETSASLPKWKRPAKTTEDLPWADIAVIDISTYDTPGGKQKLAEQLRKAVHETGFFSLISTGFTDEEVTRQFSIGQAYFDSPLEERNKPELCCDFGKGNYFGYRAVRCSKTEILRTVLMRS